MNNAFSGADCNIPKRYTDPSNDDGQTPLHMAVGWGLTRVAEALIKYGADLNAQVCLSHTYPNSAKSRTRMIGLPAT